MGLPILRSAALVGNSELYTSLGGRLRDIGACSPFHLDHHNPGESYIAYLEAVELLECAADRLGRPDYGLQLSTLQDLGVLGALGVAAQATQTLRDSYRLAEKFMGYHSPLIRVRLEPLPDDRYELISFDIDLDSRIDAIQAFELSVGVTHRCYKLLTNSSSQPLEIWMRHQPVSPMATYRKIFGMTPKFDQTVCGIVVHKSQLLRRPPNQDPTLSLTEISQRLHYSEASAFTRSCRRWFGKAPRSYRQREHGAAAVTTA